MTIKTRNIAATTLFFVSTAILIANIILLAYAIYTKSLALPEDLYDRIFYVFSPNRFTFATAMISVFSFTLYVSVVLVYFLVSFEKTQSSEIVFFSLFLVGCLMESCRVLIPIFNLWHSYSSFSHLCGRLVIFGRTLAPLGLLTAVIASATEQRQNVGQNLILIIFISLAVAYILPLDNAHITLQCVIPWGKHSMFSASRFLILLMAVIAQAANTVLYDRGKIFVLSFAVLCLGYLVLCLTFSILTLACGLVLIGAGTYFYLTDLHRQYLWK